MYHVKFSYTQFNSLTDKKLIHLLITSVLRVRESNTTKGSQCH